MEIDVDLSNDFNRGLIEHALAVDINGMTIDDVEMMVLDVKMQFWAIRNGSMLAGAVTGVNNLFGQKVLIIVALGGGEMDKWLEEFLATMEDYAELMNCQRIVAYGREGWSRVGRLYGWEYAFTAIKKEM